MAKFSHMIFYVEDIPKGLSFYEKVFDIKPKFVHESGLYAELETGSTALAFAADSLGKDNLPEGYVPTNHKLPFGAEIAFTVDDVPKYYKKALSAKAQAVHPPVEKPWGQTVAYVRDPNGVLIEIASIMTS